MPNPIMAGELLDNVRLYDVPGETQDEYGQVSDTSSLIGTFKAKVEHLKGRELMAAMQVYTSVTHRVTMRWLGSAIPVTDHNPNAYILPRMYLLLDDDRRLDIVDADDEVKGKHGQAWILTCNEKVVS